MSDHSILAPSSYGRTVECPGSVIAGIVYPDDDSSESIEGTQSHELAAELIMAASRGSTPDGNTSAHIYAAHVLSVMRDSMTFTPHVEERVTIPSVHPDAYGTPDCWLMDRRRYALHVWDYKHGRVYVDARDNYQLVGYDSGIIDTIDVDPFSDLIIHNHIVQPRCRGHDNIRTWTTSANALRPYVNRLADAAENALSTNPRFAAGIHCKYCKSRVNCDTFDVEINRVISYIEEVDTDMIRDRAAERVRLKYAEDMIKAASLANDGAIEGALSRGEVVGNLVLSPNVGNLKWTIDNDQVIKLGEANGVCLSKGSDVLTPTQSVDAGLDMSIVTTYASRAVKGNKITTSKFEDLFNGNF